MNPSTKARIGLKRRKPRKATSRRNFPVAAFARMRVGGRYQYFCQSRLRRSDRRWESMKTNTSDTIRSLVEKWCERKHFGPLALVLPAWISNNGLTDGWEILYGALKHAHAMCTDLPPDERDVLKQVYVAIDEALRNR
jgi:hypothetical protein